MKKKLSRNAIIGLTFIVSLIMLYFGINFLKGVNVFRQQHRFYVTLDNVTSLLVSSPIYLHGFQIGLVNNIRMAGTNPVEFVVGVHFTEKFPIPKDSYMRYSVDIFGSSAVDLIMGTSRQLLQPGDTLRGEKMTGLMDGVTEIMPKADAVLMNIDSVLVTLNSLLSNPVWEQTIENIGGTVAQLNRSSASLTRVIAALEEDLPTISQNLTDVSSNLKSVSNELSELDLQSTFASIDETINNLNSLTARLNSNDNSIGRLLHDPSLHDSLSITLSNAAQLLEDIRQNPERYLSVRVRLFGN
jgi:phospholipid/cholesterol/gamma-HCH transport system substrate-binding protein